MDNACPCGSGREFAACCQPYLVGDATPPTAEATMRSRYSAFVAGDVDYIIATHHSDTRDQVDREHVEHWSKDSEWLGLEITGTTDGEEGDDEGVVKFVARYNLDGQLHNHREESLFTREDGDWKFYNVVEDIPEDQPELVPVTSAPTIGRNDPCTCGSGKKYKKCHGAAT